MGDQGSHSWLDKLKNVGYIAGVITAVLAAYVGIRSLFPASVSIVDVNPVRDSVAVGVVTKLQAIPKDSKGTPVLGRTVEWTSDDPRIATVSAEGVVAGVSPGTTTIRAKSENHVGASVITVTSSHLTGLELFPDKKTIQVGGAVTLGLYAEGKLLENAPVQWSSDVETVASVSEKGNVEGMNPGAATITAFSHGVKSQAAINVIPKPPPPQQTSGPATADPAPSPGTGGGQRGAQTGKELVLMPAIISKQAIAVVMQGSVEITPAPVSLVAGRSLQLHAAVKDRAGAIVAGAEVKWASENEAVAKVSESGVVTGVGAGQTKITASSGNRVGSMTVEVTLLQLRTIQAIRPNRP